jgi:hypothetical protein
VQATVVMIGTDLFASGEFAAALEMEEPIPPAGHTLPPEL